MKKYIYLILSLMVVFPSMAEADLNPLLMDQMKHETRKVVGVLSSNMIMLDSNERVRLIGLKEMDTPKPKNIERDKHGFIVEDLTDPRLKLEEHASRFMRDLLIGERVTLKFDAQRRASDGYLEAYVYLEDGRMANDIILREGYADLQLRPPNMKHAKQLRDAYREASQEQRGIQGRW